MRRRAACEVQPEPILVSFFSLSVSCTALRRPGSVAASQQGSASVCVLERRISRDEARGGGCKSERHLLPGLWRVLWGQQRQISHRSYLLHSSQRQFVLAADHPGKEKERIGFLFKGRGNSSSVSCVFAFFSLSGVFRERLVTKVGSKSSLKPQVLQIDIPNTVLESFLEK